MKHPSWIRCDHFHLKDMLKHGIKHETVHVFLLGRWAWLGSETVRSPCFDLRWTDVGGVQSYIMSTVYCYKSRNHMAHGVDYSKIPQNQPGSSPKYLIQMAEPWDLSPWTIPRWIVAPRHQSTWWPEFRKLGKPHTLAGRIPWTSGRHMFFCPSSQRFVLGGLSAGGQLAAMTALERGRELGLAGAHISILASHDHFMSFSSWLFIVFDNHV